MELHRQSRSVSLQQNSRTHVTFSDNKYNSYTQIKTNITSHAYKTAYKNIKHIHCTIKVGQNNTHMFYD